MSPPTDPNVIDLASRRTADRAAIRRAVLEGVEVGDFASAVVDAVDVVHAVVFEVERQVRREAAAAAEERGIILGALLRLEREGELERAQVELDRARQRGMAAHVGRLDQENEAVREDVRALSGTVDALRRRKDSSARVDAVARARLEERVSGIADHVARLRGEMVDTGQHAAVAESTAKAALRAARVGRWWNRPAAKAIVGVVLIAAASGAKLAHWAITHESAPALHEGKR